MWHFYDRAGFARALTLDLKPSLKRLLAAHIGALTEDLKDRTEYLVLEPADGEEDVVRHIGLSPFVEPFDGIRWGEPGFWPHWDYLQRTDDHYVLTFTFGSAFAYVLIVPLNAAPNFVALCREFVGN
jgi:hypothetical protein